MLMADRPTADHYDYEVNEVVCRCRLCTDYQQAKTAYETVKQQRGRHHRFCRCEACTAAKSRFVDYLAALNRLEIYSEMSYVLASAPRQHPLSGECLQWAYTKILDPDYRGLTWWALSSDRRTLRSWIDDFQKDWGGPTWAPHHRMGGLRPLLVRRRALCRSFRWPSTPLPKACLFTAL
jgi:hypothetical protein